MRLRILAGLIIAAVAALGQDAPIYRVTVVERTMKAINYQYRNGPTTIDFQGTVLMPKAKGEAIVESKQGRTEIDLHFDHLSTPQGFGLEYMTYVLWAITPEGRPRNLGEVVVNSSDKASLHVTTDLKAFGLLVTAEPYSAVRQPGDVVVAENRVREDTIGKIEEINVKYDLMPRGHYTWNVSNELKAEIANAPKVSMRKYEALLELYQAQNALAIARNAGASTYAPNTFSKAEALLTEAQQINASKNGDSHAVVDSAREAAQTAEDARQIAERRMHDDQLAKANAKVTSAEQARAAAEAEVLRARADADAARSQADAERVARQQAEAASAVARDRAAQAEQAARDTQAQASAANAAATAVTAGRVLQEQVENQKAELRMRLLEQPSAAAAPICRRTAANRAPENFFHCGLGFTSDEGWSRPERGGERRPDRVLFQKDEQRNEAGGGRRDAADDRAWSRLGEGDVNEKHRDGAGCDGQDGGHGGGEEESRPGYGTSRRDGGEDRYGRGREEADGLREPVVEWAQGHFTG